MAFSILSDIVDVGLMIATVLTGTVCLSATLVMAMCPPRQLKECLRCKCLRRTRPREDTDELEPMVV